MQCATVVSPTHPTSRSIRTAPAAALLVVCGLLPQARAADVVAITATGSGATVAEAISNAKRAAIEHAAGVFLSSKRTIQTQPPRVSDRIIEYTGGVIRAVHLGTAHLEPSGLFSITIQADVDLDKNNTATESTGEEVPGNAKLRLGLRREHEANAQRAIEAMDRPQDALVVHVEGATFETSGQDVIAHIHALVEWNPKWIDDMRVLAAQIGPPIQFFDRGRFLFCLSHDYRRPQPCHDLDADLRNIPGGAWKVRIAFRGTGKSVDIPVLDPREAVWNGKNGIVDITNLFRILPAGMPLFEQFSAWCGYEVPNCPDSAGPGVWITVATPAHIRARVLLTQSDFANLTKITAQIR